MIVNLRKICLIGYWLIIAGAVFAVIETLYFGSNWLPMSKAELICDLIATTIMSSGTSLFVLCFVIKTNNDIKELKQKL